MSIRGFAARFWRSSVLKVSCVVAAAFCLAFVLGGCDDDYVRITRDPDVRIIRGQTWAWQPAAGAPNGRPVISRDTMGRNSAPVVNDSFNDVTRDKIRTAIEHDLTVRGLGEVGDPRAADYLVDYHYAVQGRTVTEVYPGGYPGVVCGPFRCWEGWGWGPPGYENVHFREGTFVFDFYKNPAHLLAYRAVGAKPVNHNTFTFTQEQVNGMVHALLKDFKVHK